MTPLGPSFLIDLSSFLQVTRTCMKAGLSSEISALERLK